MTVSFSRVRSNMQRLQKALFFFFLFHLYLFCCLLPERRQLCQQLSDAAEVARWVKPCSCECIRPFSARTHTQTQAHTHWRVSLRRSRQQLGEPDGPPHGFLSPLLLCNSRAAGVGPLSPSGSHRFLKLPPMLLRSTHCDQERGSGGGLVPFCARCNRKNVLLSRGWLFASLQTVYLSGVGAAVWPLQQEGKQKALLCFFFSFFSQKKIGAEFLTRFLCFLFPPPV